MGFPSEAYWRALEDSKVVHKTTKTFSGRIFRPHAAFCKEIIDRLGCLSCLDYGCGKGQQYEWVMPNRQMTFEQWWGVEVKKYDPAWPAFAEEPVGKFDLVICSHVLGTIPVKDLSWALDRIYGYAGKAVYFAEIIGPSSKKAMFHDADNLPCEWTPEQWMAALRRDTPLEVTLACKEQDGEIRHYRLFDWGWGQVHWPDGTKVLDHTWA